MNSMKTFVYWIVAAAGAALILIAPFNLKGLGIAALGVAMLVAGLVPAMKARRQARLDREREL
jgi:hypothetical protein